MIASIKQIIDLTNINYFSVMVFNIPVNEYAVGVMPPRDDLGPDSDGRQ